MISIGYRITRRTLRGVVLALLALLAHGVVRADDDTLEHGRYVFFAAGCVSCHGAHQTLAGGRALVTPFGTFYPPNITPDREHGIGTWSAAEFMRALREGVDPRGEPYYPAFPYPSYTGMTNEDMQALYAYLMTQPADSRPNRRHELPWFLSYRPLIRDWKAGRFEPGVLPEDPAQTPQWNRGAYIARSLGHCGECHTPRGLLGAPRAGRYLAGARSGPDGVTVPNITPDPATGIGEWTTGELFTYLSIGQRPDGRYASQPMLEVLGTSIMPLTESDRHALASYLQSLPPVRHDVYTRYDPFAPSWLRE
ncbi:MAG: cytochrome c [Gammaproteobacteria bacterium]